MKPYLLSAVHVILILCITNTGYAQQLVYTPEQKKAIHDSIKQSRWDVGGRLSQYSFRYMSEFFPVADIPKSTKPFVFKSSPKKAFDEIVVKSNTGNLSLDKYLRSLHIAGFIVVNKGSVVYEQYNSILPTDKNSLQSVTKVITSALITNLINEKKIDPSKTIDTYISELKGSDWEGITVRQVLDMRSGMDSKSIDFSTGPFTNPEHKNYGLESALGILPKAPNTPASPYTFLAELKKDKAPGVAAEYSNLNTFVLGWLAEKITGKKYATLVSERIWQPMGASSDAYVCVSKDGIAWPHGGVSATLRDLARFGMLFTNSEIKARKESIISFAQQQEIFDAPPAIENSPVPFKWAYQWDLASDGIMLKSGFGGQALYIVPEKDIVIAYFNYVDSDWSIDNMISFQALKDIVNTAGK
ncbi:MAG: serine hydrolase domain-containing protein [Flavitalea sp.]